MQYKSSLSCPCYISFSLAESWSKMQTALVLLMIGAAVLFAEAQYHDYYRPPSCGRCDYRDFVGKPGPPGRKVWSIN